MVAAEVGFGDDLAVACSLAAVVVGMRVALRSVCYLASSLAAFVDVAALAAGMEVGRSSLEVEVDLAGRAVFAFARLLVGCRKEGLVCMHSSVVAEVLAGHVEEEPNSSSSAVYDLDVDRPVKKAATDSAVVVKDLVEMAA